MQSDAYGNHLIKAIKVSINYLIIVDISNLLWYTGLASKSEILETTKRNNRNPLHLLLSTLKVISFPVNRYVKCKFLKRID